MSSYFSHVMVAADGKWWYGPGVMAPNAAMATSPLHGKSVGQPRGSQQGYLKKAKPDGSVAPPEPNTPLHETYLLVGTVELGKWTNALRPAKAGDYPTMTEQTLYSVVSGVSCGAARAAHPYPAGLEHGELAVVHAPFVGVWGVTGIGEDGQYYTYFARAVKRDWGSEAVLEGLAMVDVQSLFVGPVMAKSFADERYRHMARVHMGLQL